MSTDESAADDHDRESQISARSDGAFSFSFSAGGWNSGSYAWGGGGGGGAPGSTAGSGVGDGYGYGYGYGQGAAPWGSYLSGNSGSDGGGGCGVGGRRGCGLRHHLGDEDEQEDNHDNALHTATCRVARDRATSALVSGHCRARTVHLPLTRASSTSLFMTLPFTPSHLSRFPSSPWALTPISTPALEEGGDRKPWSSPSLSISSHLRSLLRSLLGGGGGGGGSGAMNAYRRLVLVVLTHCIASVLLPDLLPSLLCSSSPVSTTPGSSYSAPPVPPPPWSGSTTAGWGRASPCLMATLALAALVVGFLGTWVLREARRRAAATPAVARGPVAPAVCRFVCL